MPDTCHILVSDGFEHDSFCEMTYISVALTKRLYPDCTATILSDRQTIEHLPYQLENLVEIDIPSEFSTAAARSRYLKTRMRQLVDGDFVFLDADALPLHPFDELVPDSAPFAAALDRNRESPEPIFPQWVVPHFETMSWNQPVANYFNSGVMFMADSPEMRALSDSWHDNWRAMFVECGVHQDQPSLNHTLEELVIPTQTLSIKFNAMVDASPYFARGANIIHYFLRGETRQPDPASLLSHLIGHLHETDEIDWKAVDRAAKRSDAWVHPTNSLHIELATRHYLRAIGIATSRVFLRS